MQQQRNLLQRKFLPFKIHNNTFQYGRTTISSPESGQLNTDIGMPSFVGDNMSRIRCCSSAVNLLKIAEICCTAAYCLTSFGTNDQEKHFFLYKLYYLIARLLYLVAFMVK